MFLILSSKGIIMGFITIVLFFVYAWGLGFTLTSIIKNSENFLERQLIRIGIGLGVFVVLGVILNFLHIMLDWRLFFLLSIIYPIFEVFRRIKKKQFNKKNFKFKLTKSNLNIFFVMLIFFACLQMYSGGAFKYPYLEDDDPWIYAQSMKYVAEEKTVSSPEGFTFKYMDPYPPGYSLLIGVLHQTSESLMWTMKFFNGLLISLGILFFYFFAKKFMGDKNKALFATFVIAAIPSFFTHFIWAHSFVVMLFFPTMYSLEMIIEDKRWFWIGMVLIASILLTQPSQALKLCFMIFIYFIVKCIYEKKFLKELFYAQLGGVLISLIWWGFKIGDLMRVRMQKAAIYATNVGTEEVSSGLFSKIQFFITNYLRPDMGTATRPYSFNDFFIAQPFGGINVHVGWGVFLSILFVFGLIYLFLDYKKFLNKEGAWITIILVWFLFTFLGVNSETFNLPIGFFAFRFWLLMAIPVSLISSLGLWLLFAFFKNNTIIKIIILLVAISGVIGTAGYQKYNHNTLSNWPPGVGWTSTEELNGFLWLKTLPADTKIFTFYKDDRLAGLDKYSCDWCNDVLHLRERARDLDSFNLNKELKILGYEYIVISGNTARNMGVDEANKKIQDLISTNNYFVSVHKNTAFFAFKLI